MSYYSTCSTNENSNFQRQGNFFYIINTYIRKINPDCKQDEQLIYVHSPKDNEILSISVTDIDNMNSDCKHDE